MLILTSKQIEAVIKLPVDKRYQHCIRRAVDQEELWGIYDSDWVKIKHRDGSDLFPIWPNKEYAQLYLQKNFPSTCVKAIDVYEFINTFLRELEEQNIAVSAFPTLESEGHMISHAEIIDDLNEELENY